MFVLLIALFRQANGTLFLVSTAAPLAQRSYLGTLLPESLLYILETYGA